MSRSNPPRSPIVAKIKQSSVSERHAAHARSFRRRFAIRSAALMRWLHIYLSMFGLAAVFFFGITGLTLNHPDWFFAESERTAKAEGRLDARWLHLDTRGDRDDPARQVAKLEVVEHLRKAHGIHGALAEFQVDDAQCLVTFKGPGYAADVTIDRESGRYEVNQTLHGVVAVLNDLHKGRDAGPVWSVVVDVSAVLVTLISLTGLVLLFYLKLRRVPGLVVALVGTVAVVAAYLFGVK